MSRRLTTLAATAAIAMDPLTASSRRTPNRRRAGPSGRHCPAGAGPGRHDEHHRTLVCSHRRGAVDGVDALRAGDAPDRLLVCRLGRLRGHALPHRRRRVALGHRLHRVGRARDGDGVPVSGMSSSSTRGIIVAAVPAFGADSAGTSVTAHPRPDVVQGGTVAAALGVGTGTRPGVCLGLGGAFGGTAGPTGASGTEASSPCRQRQAQGRRALHGTSCTCRCVGAGSGRGAGLAAVVVLALGVLAAVGLASGGALDLRASSHPRHGRGDDGHGGQEGEPGHDCQDSKGDGGREGGQ